MYFNGLAEKLGSITDYMIELMETYQDEIRQNSAPDLRKLLGEKSLVLPLRSASLKLKDTVEFIQYYIVSQQYPVLRDRIPYERSVVTVKELKDSTNMPNRYLNRIGESIVVVTSGRLILESEEFTNKVIMSKGDIYRYNSRIPLNYEFTEDFSAIVFSFVDFDLSHYLMPFDMYGIMPRRRDEWPDYDPNDESHKLDKISTNEY